MANHLGPYELYKYDWRVEEFVDRFSNGGQFMLTNGEPVYFVFDSSIANRIKNKEVKGLKLQTDNGQLVSLSKIKKTNNEDFGKFGGKDSNEVFKQENVNLKQLNKDLEVSQGHFSVLGDRYSVDELKITPSGSKADFYTERDTPFFLSHKHGSEPYHFQQWGGITMFKDHPEVRYFIERVTEHGDLQPGYSSFMEIRDAGLKFMSMYGVNYGLAKGLHNVDFVAQGTTKIENGQLVASKIFKNGDLPLDHYRPVLCCIYKGVDRNQFGIRSARFSISPFGTRRFKQEIVR